MAKRFTDTEKWKKPFIRSMKAPYKLLWLYILDECDHAGIWQVDFEVAEIKLGEKLKMDEAIKFFSGKIHVFDSGNKWFLPDFLEFQYGILNPENRAHNSVLQILNKYGIDPNKPLTSPLQGAMDMDKDKDMDMDKDKGEKNSQIIYPFKSENFMLAWDQWKSYKNKEFRFKYKSEISEQAALNSLQKVSGNIEDNALKIIAQSISNGWSGLFELTKNTKQQNERSRALTGENKLTSTINAATNIAVKRGWIQPNGG